MLPLWQEPERDGLEVVAWELDLLCLLLFNPQSGLETLRDEHGVDVPVPVSPRPSHDTPVGAQNRNPCAQPNPTLDEAILAVEELFLPLRILPSRNLSGRRVASRRRGLLATAPASSAAQLACCCYCSP